MPTLIGTGLNQVPTNADLGGMSTQDPNSIMVTGGSITLQEGLYQGYYQDNNLSDIRPSLLLDFVNSGKIDSRIQWSRASTGTYYDGRKQVKAEENRSPNSQDCTAWAQTRCTVRPNTAIAPDGTLTADMVVEDTSSTTTHNIQIPSGYGTTSAYIPYTFSVFAKAAGRTWISLAEYGSSKHTYFDIQNGVVGSTAIGHKASIVSVGNGWYRCIVTYLQPVSHSYNAIVFLASQNGNTATEPTYTGDGVSGVYLWGGQFEQRSFAGPYTPTTSTPVTNYTPALLTAPVNTGRLDYNPVTGEAKGLLIEETRTNYVLYSSKLAGYVSATGVTITNNETIAPDGTMTASKIVPTAFEVQHNISINAGQVSSANTFSIFAKAAGYKFLGIFEAGINQIIYNLEAGTIDYNAGAATGTITPVGNGWYRCSYTKVLSYSQIYVASLSSAFQSGIVFAADGYKGVYVWGAQCEVGYTMSSYIPTNGAQVTRTRDLGEILGQNFLDFYNHSESTLHCEFTSLCGNNDNTYQGIVSIDNRTYATPSVYIAKSRSGWAGGVFYMNAYSTNSLTSPLSYADGSYKMASSGSNIANTTNYANFGGGLATQTQPSIPQIYPPERLALGDDAWGDPFKQGYIRKVAYYPVRLSQTEIQEMTL